jgi:hypothetical protein
VVVRQKFKISQLMKEGSAIWDSIHEAAQATIAIHLDRQIPLKK